MNGMSATISARVAPRATARVWCTMSSSVTGSVCSWPSTTTPTESPTSSTSTPARSSSRAIVASYAVSMAIFSPRRFRSRRSGTRTLVSLIGDGPRRSLDGCERLRKPGVDGVDHILADVAILELGVFADFAGDGRREQVIDATHHHQLHRLALAVGARHLDETLGVGREHLVIERAVHEQHRLAHVFDRLGGAEEQEALHPGRVGFLAHVRGHAVPPLARHHGGVNLLLERH